MLKPLIPLTLGLALCAPLHARADISLIAFNEVLKNQVPVSGSVVTGLMATVDNQIVGDEPLVLYVSDKAKQDYCVTLTSRDGMYRASARYSVTGLTPGMHAFPFPTKHRDHLRARQQNELAVLARLVSDCDQPGGNITLAQWGESPAQRSVKLVANSSRTISQIDMDEPRTTVACQMLSDANLITFDTTCTIDTTGLKNARGYLTRKRFRNPLPPVQLNLLMP